MSHEVAVKVLTRAQLSGTGGSTFKMAHLQGWQVGAGSRTQLLSVGPLSGLLECLQDMEARFSQIKWLVREKARWKLSILRPSVRRRIIISAILFFC